MTLPGRPVAYDDPRLQVLLAEVQGRVRRALWRPGSDPIDPEGFAPPSGTFLLGLLDGEPVACGGYRRHEDEVVEIKRMYVRAGWRRQGIARELLAELEHRPPWAGYQRRRCADRLGATGGTRAVSVCWVDSDPRLRTLQVESREPMLRQGPDAVDEGTGRYRLRYCCGEPRWRTRQPPVDDRIAQLLLGRLRAR